MSNKHSSYCASSTAGAVGVVLPNRLLAHMGFAKYFLIAIVAACVGVYLGANFREPLKASPIPIVQSIKNPDVRETPDGSTKFTSPLLECAELPESVSETSLDGARLAAQKIIDAEKQKGDISEASVYFRDLNNGPWFGINEEANYFPASLLKLPLAMSFYDRSEDVPNLMSTQITYTPDPSVTSQLQPFAGKDQLVANKKYTVQQLLDLMLTESNNEAANALAMYGGTDLIDNVYRDLALALPKAGEDYSISTHKYASFFRILYNATYVDRTASEKILKTLSEATFADGIVAGVPQGVNVSHKFGSRSVDNAGTVQLHDCGIVYAANKPFILCIMTQGTDFNKLASVIKQISSTVYGAVTSNPTGN